MTVRANEIRDDLHILTQFSSFLNREIGLCVCDTGEQFLTFGDETSGQICCRGCNPRILFHTHPSGVLNPSVEDLNSLMEDERNLGETEYCIGAMEGDKPQVRCFDLSKEQDRLKLVSSMPCL